jgi:hypothetical protein
MTARSFNEILLSMVRPNGTRVSDREVLWRMSGGRCFWCDEPMLLRSSPFHARFMTCDHINVRGSKLPRTNCKVAACRECNIERGCLPADQYWRVWANRLGALP